MKSTALTRIAAVACFAAAASPAQVSPQNLPHYRVTDLGVLGSGYGISSNGQVVGATQTGTAFLWRRGQIINLGTLGGANSGASGVNASGEVALSSETSMLDNEDFCAFHTHHQCLAAFWKNGALTKLPPIPGGHNSQAYSINQQGEVIGFAENGFPDSSCASGTPSQVVRYQPVIWGPNGEIRKTLQPFGGDEVAFAWGINNRGQSVGGSGPCSTTSLPPNIPFAVNAVLWEKDGTPKFLGNLGGAFSIPTAINNRGEVVGGAESAKDGMGHIFLWTEHTGMQDLGTFPGAAFTVAPCCNTINDRGQIAGFVMDTNGNQRAFLWQNDVWMDVNDLIPKNSGWILQAAESIDNAGQITGSGTIRGEVHAFLATPCGDDGEAENCGSPDR